MIDPPGLWEGVVRRLDGQVPAVALDAWLRPLEPEARSGGIRLLCRSELHRQRVERYLDAIAHCAEAEAGMPIQVELAVRPQETRLPETPSRNLEVLASAPRAARTLPVRTPIDPRPRAAQPTLPLSFETFVVGSCNALAREAAFALARGRQGGASPLFLASGAGLGKTHLACSVAREVRRGGLGRVVYASAETFTSQLMTSIRSGATAEFKRRFREQCDVLVLEDVQFFGGKAATQMELFHTLQHLKAAGRLLVLTADRLPRELEGFDARSVSVMASGLVAEIEPPDAQVRREILRSRSAAGGVRLPDSCLERLVEGVRGSVRDLEGVLIQLVSSSVLLERPIDLELTEAALHKVSPEAPGRSLEPAQVVGVVTRFFGTSPDILAQRSRRRDVLLPRKLAMYLCRRYTNASLAEIGRLFGRNHTAARNAYESVEREILKRAPLRYQVEELARRVEAERRLPGA
jgi:chromosomal replication initiator protein